MHLHILCFLEFVYTLTLASFVDTLCLHFSCASFGASHCGLLCTWYNVTTDAANILLNISVNSVSWWAVMLCVLNVILSDMPSESILNVVKIHVIRWGLPFRSVDWYYAVLLVLKLVTDFEKVDVPKTRTVILRALNKRFGNTQTQVWRQREAVAAVPRVACRCCELGPSRGKRMAGSGHSGTGALVPGKSKRCVGPGQVRKQEEWRRYYRYT